jgi:hypothetical protein
MHFTGTMNHWDPAVTDSFAKDGRLEARRNALVPRRADPRIAIFARRELVRPDAGANALGSRQMIEAVLARFVVSRACPPSTTPIRLLHG